MPAIPPASKLPSADYRRRRQRTLGYEGQSEPVSAPSRDGNARSEQHITSRRCRCPPQRIENERTNSPPCAIIARGKSFPVRGTRQLTGHDVRMWSHAGKCSSRQRQDRQPVVPLSVRSSDYADAEEEEAEKNAERIDVILKLMAEAQIPTAVRTSAEHPTTAKSTTARSGTAHQARAGATVRVLTSRVHARWRADGTPASSHRQPVIKRATETADQRKARAAAVQRFAFATRHKVATMAAAIG